MSQQSAVPTLLRLALVLAAACACSEAVAPARQPFHGSLSGRSEFGGPCADAGAMQLTDRGSGMVSPLGASTMEMSGCYIMTATGFASAGTSTGQFVAADGDTLRFTGLSATGDMTTGVAHSTYVLQGGSGRFQPARGEYEVVTKLQPDGAWTSEVSGWIAY